MDRQRLLAVPVPARDESRTEYREAAKWKSRFSSEFSELFADWLPNGVTSHDAIEVLRIPYVPYWSFGERLPVIEEGFSDPSSLGHAYELLSRLLDARLDWHKAMEGQSPGSDAQMVRRDLGNEDWRLGQRVIALHALKEAGGKSYMEVYHICRAELSEKDQIELLEIARAAQIRRTGWPIGVVLDGSEHRPRPTKNGIVVVNPNLEDFDFWALRSNGDFYSLRPFWEDNRAEGTMFFDLRIAEACEVLQRAGKQYRALGASAFSEIEVKIRYSGIGGRGLKSSRSPSNRGSVNTHEDQVDVSVSFRLGELEAELVTLTERLCAPLFLVFDFAKFDDSVYSDIVTKFVAGKVS